jgi:hypothetical protein
MIHPRNYHHKTSVSQFSDPPNRAIGRRDPARLQSKEQKRKPLTYLTYSKRARFLSRSKTLKPIDKVFHPDDRRACFYCKYVRQ